MFKLSNQTQHIRIQHLCIFCEMLKMANWMRFSYMLLITKISSNFFLFLFFFKSEIQMKRMSNVPEKGLQSHISLNVWEFLEDPGISFKCTRWTVSRHLEFRENSHGVLEGDLGYFNVKLNCFLFNYLAISVLVPILNERTKAVYFLIFLATL